MNFNALHTFVKGLQGDFVNNAETNETFQKGVNGRLVSKNGMLSFSSIQGNKKVYENENIIKYLGYEAFIDELIIFVKLKCDQNEIISTETITEDIVTIDNIPNAEIVDGEFNFQFTDVEVTESQIEYEQIVNNNTIGECEVSIESFDPSNLYSINNNVPNLLACNQVDTSIPINNQDYCDAIFSLKYDALNQLQSTLIWKGYQNWDINSKIVCLGIKETQNIKSIYYTDFLNPFRKVNIKNTGTVTQNADDFSLFQNTPLINPKFIEYIDGSLFGMSVFYTYRLIAKNGQLTEFSPLSNAVIIPKKYTNDEFEGSEPEEITSFGVKIKCEILNTNNYIEVEAYAIEYQAKDVPTAIRKLGTKNINGVVEFNHTGNEEEYSNSTTIIDLLNNKSNWQYCSALEHKDNMLIVGGIRNNPISKIEDELRSDFKLKAWDQYSNTFEGCQYNPDPKLYKYIFPGFTEKLKLTKEIHYKSIRVYGNYNVKLKNSLYEISLNVINSNNYNENITSIKNWLIEQSLTNDFQTLFSNLKISFVDGVLVFGRIDENILTDLNDYEFTFSTLQVQIDSEYVYDFNSNTPTGQKVNGAISYGFNSGNGIRISFTTEDEKVLKKATETYEGNDKIFNLYLPNLKKGFFKNEIYRLFIEFKTNQEKLFAIPLGDICIPKTDEIISFIDEDGNAVITTNKYVNQFTINNDLYVQKIKIKIEVRLNCKFKKDIKTYQLMYVERTEDNRTILAQGISAPLMKFQRTSKYLNYFFNKEETLVDHWLLPYAGGPAYELSGFQQYDENGNSYDEELWSGDSTSSEGIEVARKRVIYSRNLMYFDAPDIIFGGVSSRYVSGSKLSLIGIVSTDEENSIISKSGRTINNVITNEVINLETYPKFSRKIYWEKTSLNENLPYPRIAHTDFQDYWNNASVFSNIKYLDAIHSVNSNIELNPGEVTYKDELNLSHNIANNAMYTPMNQSWFYGRAQRCFSQLGGDCDDEFKYKVIINSVRAKGKSTVMIKSDTDLFTNNFTSYFPNTIKVNPSISQGYNDFNVSTNHAIINIYRNNDASVYGGKSEEAFSNNIIIPLGNLMPVHQSSNAAQVSIEDGDTYTTLFIRTKTGHSTSEYRESDRVFNGGTNCSNMGDNNIYEYKRLQGGWVYAVVLETMLEPKLSYDARTDLGEKLSFDIDSGDNIISGYLQQRNLKTSKSKPFRFTDDPEMENIVAISKTKLYGDYYDAWSEFLSNEFHELDKDKGPITNLIINADNLYAIQAKGVAYIGVNEKNIVQTDKGEFTINSGNGTSISAHKYVSDFGTSIRRNVISNLFGFTFYDENKNELIKDLKPLFIENNNSLVISELFENDKVIDAEIYFDFKYKETNIRLVTQNGKVYLISYNELLKVFNGNYEYDHDVYMEFKEKILAPKKQLSSGELINKDLMSLNDGNVLNIDDNLKSVSIGFVCAIQSDFNKIYKTIELITNIDYRVNFVKITTNLNEERIISGDHFWYKIREGKHSIPLKNQMIQFDIDEYKDMRGSWAYIEINVSSQSNKKIDIFAVDVQLRKSYS